MSEFGEREPQIDAWRAVERIPFGRVTADEKEALLDYIEAPLRPAIGAFFDRNITTMGSSCNMRDFQGASDPEQLGRPMAWISLDWTVLSDANRTVFKEYPHNTLISIEGIDGNTYELAGLFFPISPNDFPEDIGRKALELAEKFEQQ
jgi:hypothetical protein